MLLSVVAASITLVVVRQSLLAGRADAQRADAQAATRAAADAKARFEAALADDPAFFLRRVWEFERARVCVAVDDDPGPGVRHPVVQPGGDWPAGCGSAWGYQRAESPGGVRAEVRAPGGEYAPAGTVGAGDEQARDTLLHLRILARVGDAEDGLAVVYRRDTAGRFVAFSDADLRLDDLGRGAGSSSLSGTVYTGGRMYLPGAGAGTVTIADAQLAAAAADSPFVPAPDDPALRYYAPVPDPAATPPLRDLRRVAQNVPTVAALRASASRARELACPSPAQTPTKAPSGRASAVCLAAGRQVLDVSGSPLTVPDAAGWLLAFGRSGPGTVDVFWTPTTPAPAGDCALRCSTVGLAAGEVAAGDHPGVWPFWTPRLLGTLALPASGVIAADGDVYLGLCGDAFLTAGAACDTVSGSAPGMAVDVSTTVIAGSAGAPGDVYVAGPIHAVGDARLGVVAFGSVVLPYWSRPPGGVLHVDAALVALAPASPGRAPVRTVPAELAEPVAGDPNVAARFELVGSVAAAEVDLGFDAYAAVSLTGDARLSAAGPPWFPAFADRWRAARQSRLAPAAVCGLRACDGF